MALHTFQDELVSFCFSCFCIPKERMYLWKFCEREKETFKIIKLKMCIQLLEIGQDDFKENKWGGRKRCSKKYPS